MALAPQWLDELRSRITLSAIIGRTTRLIKAGREYKACCPFHNEKTPSFTVNDEKGFYHCFGCGAHGDAIRWLTDQRGLPFIDAVRELAAEAGMELPAPDPRAARAAEQRATLHDVLAGAQQWFVANLHGAEGAAARDYLKRRGVSGAIAQEFGFGYAPEGREALAAALSEFPKPLLIEAGLLIDAEGKEPYARFRDRLTLPIADRRGRTIAFGGRLLSDQANAPKYLNSPDTPLFDKGRVLYNQHRAAAASRNSGRVVLVEGYMDVVALAQAGIGETVAPMGTALTEQQIELMWRMTPVPVLCFDGDAAGRRAAMRAIGRALPLLRPGHSLSIVALPQGLDPDDLVRRQGAGAMEALLAGGDSLVETIWRHEREAGPLATPEDKAGLKERLLAHVDAIAHPDIRSLYRRELLDRYGAFAFPRREQRGSGRSPAQRGSRAYPSAMAAGGPPSPRLRNDSAEGARSRLTGAVLAGLARHPAALLEHDERLARLHPDDPAQAAILDAMLSLSEERAMAGKPLAPADIISILRERGLALPDRDAFGGIRFAFMTNATREHEAMAELAEAIILLVEKPAIDTALAEATSRFAEDPDGAFVEQQRLLRMKLEFERRLVKMAMPGNDTSSRSDRPLETDRTSENGRH